MAVVSALGGPILLRRCFSVLGGVTFLALDADASSGCV